MAICSKCNGLDSNLGRCLKYDSVYHLEVKINWSFIINFSLFFFLEVWSLAIALPQFTSGIFSLSEAIFEAKSIAGAVFLVLYFDITFWSGVASLRDDFDILNFSTNAENIGLPCLPCLPCFPCFPCFRLIIP